ncbi:hypothetical protein Tco_1307246, partial [Tanacetum coccineum]
IGKYRCPQAEVRARLRLGKKINLSLLGLERSLRLELKVLKKCSMKLAGHHMQTMSYQELVYERNLEEEMAILCSDTMSFVCFRCNTKTTYRNANQFMAVTFTTASLSNNYDKEFRKKQSLGSDKRFYYSYSSLPYQGLVRMHLLNVGTRDSDKPLSQPWRSSIYNIAIPITNNKINQHA